MKRVLTSRNLPDSVHRMRFGDGLVIDRRHCPQTIQAHNHWRSDPRVHPPANASCLCVLDDEADRHREALDEAAIYAPEPIEPPEAWG